MLAEWFREHPDKAIKRVEEFDKAVKKKFVDEPGQMKLLIVVDKLLTGFDAPSATYLYIDKQMRGSRALSRPSAASTAWMVRTRNTATSSTTRTCSRASKPPSTTTRPEPSTVTRKSDVAGLLEDRVEKARERLEEALEAIRASVRAGRASEGRSSLLPLLLGCRAWQC